LAGEGGVEGASHKVKEFLSTLWRVMLETVPLDQQQRLHDLLLRNRAGMLTDAESEQLAIVQQQADLVMLRKARAAVLLRFRGKRVPTLAELSQLAATDT